MEQQPTRPYFLQQTTTGLASISDIEHGFPSNPSPSSSSDDNYRAGSHLVSRPLYSPRKSNLSSFSSPRSVHSRFVDQPYFLDSCFLCKKMLGQNRDIFMYRGDTPFCSEECRAEQIDIDESKEKTKHLSSSMRALRKKKQQNETSTKYSFRSGAVAAA